MALHYNAKQKRTLAWILAGLLLIWWLAVGGTNLTPEGGAPVLGWAFPLVLLAFLWVYARRDGGR